MTITFPKHQQTLTYGDIDIRGSIKHGAKIDYFLLEYAREENPTKNDWQLLVKKPIQSREWKDETLFTWGSENLSRDTYTLRLTIFYTDGNFEPAYRCQIIFTVQ